MFVLKSNKIKWIFIVLFMVCFVTLCSCHNQVEGPIEPQETYTITYVINDHGKQPENPTNQTKLPDVLPVLTEEGWDFEGWYTTKTFEEENKAIAGTSLVEDITLYAKWIEVQTYRITFVKNGHGWNDIENLTNQTRIPNNIINLFEDGWKFGGWYYDDETFEKPAIGGTKLTEDTILYAKWIEVVSSYIVDYKINNKNAGTIIGETHQIVKKGEDTTPVTVIPNVGYKFLGWNNTGLVTDGTNHVDELTRMDTNVLKDITAIAVFQGPIRCEMKFRANEGGKVEGVLDQQVLYGGNGSVVTAIPDEEFRFVRWSDGETEAVRTNECITRYPSYNPLIYAEFERCERKFKLEYNEGTSDKGLTEYTFYLDDMEKEQYLPVPQREGYEFVGWYSDWFHTIQVTDETGKMIVDKSWFNNDRLFYIHTNPNMKLFARWKPTKEVPVYKILLIYVTEIHATLESNFSGMQTVNYVMNDLEKEYCELTSKRVEEYLEGILNSTVDFQVDTYFTKEAITESNIYRGSSLSITGAGPFYDYGIDVEGGYLPEVNDMLDDYDSVIASFHLGLTKGDGEFHVTAGHARRKYGNIYLDGQVTGLGEETLKYFLDLSQPGSYFGWVDFIGLYVHELTHTIEGYLQPEDFYGLHEAAEYFGENGGVEQTEFDTMYPYLRNEFKVGDKCVGIPYEFWTGEYERV